MANEKYWDGTYMVQVSLMPDLCFPSFQYSRVFQPAENIILVCFWDVFPPELPQTWSNLMEILTSNAMQSNE